MQKFLFIMVGLIGLINCGEPTAEDTSSNTANDPSPIFTEERDPNATHSMTFIEDLRLQGAEEHLSWSGADPVISAGDDGKMYVADVGANRIYTFDENGTYLKSIGRSGRGPGEFGRLMNMNVLNDGKIVAFDGLHGVGSLHWFDQNLKFERKTQPFGSVSLSYANISPNGHLMATRVLRTPPNQPEKLVVTRDVMTEKFKPVQTFPEYTIDTFDGSQAADPDYIIKRSGAMMKGKLASRGIIAFDTSNRIYTAMSGEYKITRWAPDGQTSELVYAKEETPRMYSESEIAAFIENFRANIIATAPSQFHDLYSRKRMEKAFEKADIPLRRNPLAGLIALPDGHLLAVRTGDINGKQRADLFNPDGTFIAQVDMDHYAFLGTNGEARMRFRNGFAYTIETDPDGDHSLVRYRYELKPLE